MGMSVVEQMEYSQFPVSVPRSERKVVMVYLSRQGWVMEQVEERREY